MRFIEDRRLGRSLIAALLVAAPLALTGWTPRVDAASSVQALVAEAEHNTNTVSTLMHRDENTITTRDLSVTVSARGSEDEVHNREHDYESVTVKGRGPTGKVQSLHYTVDIIFMNGVTYYRTSLLHNQWKTHKGMTFPDPYTGGWKRGRTTVSFPKTTTFREVGTSGGETHLQASFSQAATAGTVDLWISGGTKPYVVREEESYHATKGTSGSAHVQVMFGPFNTPLVIQSPTTQGST